MMTAIMLLSLIAVSCQPEVVDINNPDRPWVPFQGEVVYGPSGVVTDRVVVLTAWAEHAESYVWRRGGVVLEGRNYDTLQIAATGFFPDIAEITVAGQNPSGIGEFSSSRTIMFTPWEAPGTASLEWDETLNVFFDDTLRNECPTPFVLLIARIPQATTFVWHLDGVWIEDEVGPTLRVQMVFCETTDTLIGGTGSGTYTVSGFNQFGESELSNAVTVDWTRCDPFITGIWHATNSMFSYPADLNNRRGWRDSVTAQNDTSFFFWNAHNNGTPDIRVFVDPSGNFYFQGGIVVANLPGGETLRQVNIWIADPAAPGEAYRMFFGETRANLEISEDYSSFRLPANITLNTAAGPVPGRHGGVGVLRYNAAGNPAAWVDRAFDVIFERPTSTTGTSANTQDIRWIQSHTNPVVVDAQEFEGNIIDVNR